VWVTDLISPRGPIGPLARFGAVGDALRKAGITGSTIVGGHGATSSRRTSQRVGCETDVLKRSDEHVARPAMSRAPRLVLGDGVGRGAGDAGWSMRRCVIKLGVGTLDRAALVRAMMPSC